MSAIPFVESVVPVNTRKSMQKEFNRYCIACNANLYPDHQMVQSMQRIPFTIWKWRGIKTSKYGCGLMLNGGRQNLASTDYIYAQQSRDQWEILRNTNLGNCTTRGRPLSSYFAFKLFRPNDNLNSWKLFCRSNRFRCFSWNQPQDFDTPLHSKHTHKPVRILDFWPCTKQAERGCWIHLLKPTLSATWWITYSTWHYTTTNRLGYTKVQFDVRLHNKQWRKRHCNIRITWVCTYRGGCGQDTHGYSWSVHRW